MDNSFKELIRVITPLLMLSNTSLMYKVFITILLFSIDSIYSYISQYISVFKNFYKKPKLSIVIKNKLCLNETNSYHNSMSTDFSGTMLYLHDNIDNKLFDTSNLEIFSDNDVRFYVKVMYITKNPNKPLKINDDISLIITKYNKTSESKKNQLEFIIYEMEIISNSNDIKKIKDFQDEMIDYYETKNGFKKDDLYIKRIDEFISKSLMVSTRNIIFSSTKTFDNMFFEGKNNLISYLDNFMNGRDMYTKLGLPYTIGFMLHGEPGCGKTSVIKSIARYMKRNIVIVDTAKVTTRDKLETIFTKFKDDSIFVFEEIDCGPWKDIIIDRNIKKNMQCTESNDNLTIDIMKMVVDKIDNHSDEKDNKTEKVELTLSELLEVLDGIVDMDERVIIFTTNHKEMLDPALLRPGRIDHIIEFTKMSKRCIKDMYKQWFCEDIPSYVYEEMQDNIFTQAEIGKIFKIMDKKKRLDILRNGKY